MPTQTKSARSHKKVDREGLLAEEFERHRSLRVIAVVSISAIVILILAGLFAPGLDYSLVPTPAVAVDEPAFLHELEPLVSSKITRNNHIEVIENGENFYQAELEAMRQARRSINIEAYIFHKGKLTDQVLNVLSDRARAGVRVNLVMDSLGSFSTRKRYFTSLKKAGGHVEWYHRLRLHNWFITNNRTHREITIVDGATAFVGGAGYADWWRFAGKQEPRWRDTMVRVQGDAVRGLQGAFVENWLEASGEILDGPDYFAATGPDPGSSTALVVPSTPSTGGSTRSRVLFQTLIAAARKSIYITTPYFLPDRSMREELVRAKKRGVAIKIIVPGKHDDHALTRSSGRSAYGDLLKAGADIYEYEPSMIHAKITVVDGIWSVVGSTNLDNRSFGINDEINLAVMDAQVAAKLTQDFEDDASRSRTVTLQQWQKRSLWERGLELVGWVLERQQ
ncbi:MAG TPA: phospholipase D-like domain-containing protein [Terriglobales bacterium]|nr:phospholipase D-like domain-containing protein [Terriglobales bacterium]